MISQTIVISRAFLSVWPSCWLLSNLYSNTPDTDWETEIDRCFSVDFLLCTELTERHHGGVTTLSCAPHILRTAPPRRPEGNISVYYGLDWLRLRVSTAGPGHVFLASSANLEQQFVYLNRIRRITPCWIRANSLILKIFFVVRLLFFHIIAYPVFLMAWSVNSNFLGNLLDLHHVVTSEPRYWICKCCLSSIT